jgi:type IV pilus assembly protein PilM
MIEDKKVNVLIIDDHPLFRKGMVSVLQNSEIIGKIFEADNLERAYKIIEEENIDIVTLDLNLPGEDGIKFLNKYVERKFKVIVITTYNSKFLLQEVLKRGADGYIKKENLYENLIDSIKCIIDGGIYADDNHCDNDNLTIDEKASRYFFLTTAEKEVFKLLANGKNPKEIIYKMKPQAKQAIASIPVFGAFTTILKFPKMSDNELKQALIFEAKQYVPLPVSELAFDWQKIGEYEDEKGFKFNAVLLIAIPQDLIKKYQKIFHDAGLSLLALEIEPISLIRSLIFGDKTPTILVDIGSYTTSISLVKDGLLKFTSQTDFASASLTRAIASSLNINPLRAEEIKRERGILGVGADFELAQSMFPMLDIIINEIKRAEFNLKSNLGEEIQFERIILSGGGANLLGIENYFTKQLNIKTFKAEPLIHFEYNSNLELLIKELNPILAVSLGLSLREFV